MKTNLLLKRFLVAFLFFAVSTVTWAYDFEVDGICYNITSAENLTVEVTYDDKYSGEVTIPASVTFDKKVYSVTSIGNSAFYDDSGVTSVTIPESVTSIGNLAFCYCKGLTVITIPNSVTSIGSSAFSNCTGLTSVTIGNSVTSIGDGAFYSCTGLTKAEFSSIESVCGIEYKDGHSNPLTYAQHLYIDGKEVKELVIPNGVTSIGNYAFQNCKYLTSVFIPNSVTSIGYQAFYQCFGLTSVTIPNSVTSIDDYAFYWCYNLTSVTIGNGVTSIGVEAFRDCNRITSLSIGNSVTSIGYGAFYQCYVLTSVTIPNSVTSIGDDAFYGCYGLTSANIPENVTTIGYQAFSGCSGLTSIDIPNSVTSIGGGAFSSCSGLMSITVPNSVTSIESNTFSGCSGLTSITIPESVTSIGSGAFWGCSGLTSILIPASVTIIDRMVFSSCSKLTSITIPEGVTSIGYEAFYKCSGLTSVTIPNSVTSIEGEAFRNCYGLTSVTIGNRVTSIKYEAFRACTSLAHVYCLAEEVPVTSSSVFDGISLSNVKLHVPATSVDAYNAAAPWKNFGTILPIEEVTEPVYIETDVTNQFPTDYQGWTGATGYTSTQFAPRVTTNDGRYVQVCEKFNGGSATEGTVFTRTLSGLTNGTYRIELFGAAASTKGRDTGIDSEMTAENEGDETAVYLYAKTPSGMVQQYIPVHWATSFTEVATAVLNGVEVTDGTIEIGMYSEKKYTNWHVVQIKGVTALVDAEVRHADVLNTAQSVLAEETYANIVGEERTDLEQTISDNATVAERTSTAYKTAIDAIVSATTTFTEAKGSYDEWTYMKNHHYSYATAEKKAAAEAVSEAVPTSAGDAVTKILAMFEPYRQYAESSALMEGVAGAVDMTAYIKNPKAEENIDVMVWQTIRGEGSGGSIKILSGEPWTDGQGSTTHSYFDGGNWGASAWDVTFQQDVTLPKGKYQLTAMGRSETGVTLTLFAADQTAEMVHIGSMGGLFNNGWDQTSVEFELSGESTVAIGVRGVTSTSHNWMSFSDFRLFQFPNGSTGITTLRDEQSVTDNPAIYDLQGRKMMKDLKPGLYIVKGKKLLIK